ncbi:hypothetical protein HYV43_04235 [Candidatus Micrarchaeota archaeon]|nr:hypothetical protein [Candidatus Micrarchaeota archaeon]
MEIERNRWGFPVVKPSRKPVSENRRFALKTGTLRWRDFFDALKVHRLMWPDSHLVMDWKILLKQMLFNRKFQKGLWVYDREKRTRTLVGLVSTARFQMDASKVDPTTLHVRPDETVPTDYREYAHSTRGNALGCFIISNLSKKIVQDRFGRHADQVNGLLRGAAKRLIRSVNKQAARTNEIDLITAVSTPAEIEKVMGITPGEPASVEQTARYVANHDCPVLVRFHGKNGAELLKVISPLDGFRGRPRSEKLKGGGVIGLMVYPFRKGADLIVRRPKDLPQASRLSKAA